MERGITLSVVVIVVYAGGYAVLHSWLAGTPVKMWVRRVLGERSACWYRIVYNLIAILGLLPLLFLVGLLPNQNLYTFPTPLWPIALVLQGMVLLAMAYGVWITDALHFLGLRQLFSASPFDCSRNQPPLAVFGLYRWVRHPLYFLGLLLLWFTPHMTANLATLFIVFSIYLYVGTFFEEKKLIEEFGEDYRKYQRQIPRILPWRGPVRVKGLGADSFPTEEGISDE